MQSDPDRSDSVLAHGNLTLLAAGCNAAELQHQPRRILRGDYLGLRWRGKAHLYLRATAAAYHRNIADFARRAILCYGPANEQQRGEE